MADVERLVDPVVSRTKFERELAQYRQLESDHIRRGWWLVTANFPELFVVFGIPQLKPPAVAFGALLDFTNYDLWPPAVTLADPFTREPYTYAQLPSRLPQRGAPIGLVPQPGGGQVQLIGMQELMQAYGPDEQPFLCLRGVRAYHEHPGHTGDAWLRYRGTPVGTLYYLLDQLHKYGVAPINEYRRELVIQVTGLSQTEVPA